MIRSRMFAVRSYLITAKRVGTILLWVVAGIDASPRWFDLTTEEFVLCVALALTGSFAWIHRTQSRPADELYVAGKEIGRYQAMQELECANVTRLGDHPSGPAQRLRVVE